MQDDFQLTITALMRHGTTVYGGSECVTWEGAKARPGSAVRLNVAQG